MDNHILELVTELQKNTETLLNTELKKIVGEQYLYTRVKISVESIPMSLMPKDSKIQPCGTIYWLAYGSYTDDVQLQSKSGGCTVIINS